MSKSSQGQRGAIKELIYTVLIVVGAVVCIRTLVVQAFYIPSGSMEDTLLIGDYLLANKFVYGAPLDIIGTDINLGRLPAFKSPKPGDIVIFRSPNEPGKDLIKRCVAVGGQKIEIVNKKLYVDEQLFTDPPESKYTDSVIMPTQRGMRDNFGPYVVPEDHFWMMGDNRDNSADSRYFGPVSRELIKGKAMLIYWSWAADNRGHDYRGLMSIPKVVVTSIWRFPSRVRFGRMGNVIF